MSELRQEAARLRNEEGLPFSKIAGRLGVPYATVYRWLKLRPRRRAVLADLSRPRIGETSRPVASGVHVSPARRTVLGALGFTSTYKDGPEVKSGPSHPRGTGVLREYPQE